MCKERFAYVVTEPGEANDAVVTEAAFADERPRRLAACPRTGQDDVTGHGNTIDRLSEHCLNAHGHAGSSRAAVGPIAQTTAGDDRASDSAGRVWESDAANSLAGSCDFVEASRGFHEQERRVVDEESAPPSCRNIEGRANWTCNSIGGAGVLAPEKLFMIGSFCPTQIG